jgi:hypothetical protein
MIGFNALLRDEGIDPNDVKLARHQDKRFRGSPTPYALWRKADGQLELYQRIQKRAVFKDAALLAAFVATPSNDTLFVGLYRINGVEPVPDGLVDPIAGADSGCKYFYELELVEKLADYQGRLVVNWGRAYRTWVQLAHRQDKTVMEIRKATGRRC